MSKEKIEVNEYDVMGSICRESFYEFFKEFWDTIIAEEMCLNWHIEYLCNELQIMAERVFRGQKKEYNLVINVPPGTTKSTICSIMFPAWLWTRMASSRIIGASYAESLQMDLSRWCRDLIRSDKYRACFPEVQIVKDQDAKSYFLNTKKGRRKGIGVGGIAGFHGHFIIIDDPIDPKEAISQAKVEAANWWLNNSLPLRKVDKEITPMILIMQRVCVEDPTSTMLSWPDTKHICLPGETYSGAEVKPVSVKKYYKNGLLDPRRLPKVVLEDYKGKNEFLYKSQILQMPIPLGRGMFNVERISVDVPPLTFVQKIRYWDKAGTKDGGAFSVGVLMAKDKKGRFWILDVVRGQWDSAVREDMIKATAQVDGTGVLVGVEQEPGSGGKQSAEETVRNLAGFRVFCERPTGDKAQRADPFATQVNSGNVSIVKGPWNKEYVSELQYFSLLNSNYKDQVDASSGAFNRITRRRVVGATSFS